MRFSMTENDSKEKVEGSYSLETKRWSESTDTTYTSAFDAILTKRELRYTPSEHIWYKAIKSIKVRMENDQLSGEVDLAYGTFSLKVDGLCKLVIEKGFAYLYDADGNLLFKDKEKNHKLNSSFYLFIEEDKSLNLNISNHEKGSFQLKAQDKTQT